MNLNLIKHEKGNKLVLSSLFFVFVLNGVRVYFYLGFHHYFYVFVLKILDILPVMMILVVCSISVVEI